MPGPQNIAMGEEYGTELPETQVPETDMAAERNAAKFSKSKEFQALKAHLQRRIAHYQTYLPSGTAITNLDQTKLVDLGEKWFVANTIIAEFNAVIGAYEQAAEAVKEQAARDAGRNS